MLPEIEETTIGYLNQVNSVADGNVGNPFAPIKDHAYYASLLRAGHHFSFINRDNIDMLLLDTHEQPIYRSCIRYCFKHFPYESICFIDLSYLERLDKNYCMRQVLKSGISDDLVLYGILCNTTGLSNNEELIKKFKFNVDKSDDFINSMHSHLLTKINRMKFIPTYIDRMETVLYEAVKGRQHSNYIEILKALIDTLWEMEDYGYVCTFFKIIKFIRQYGTQDCVKYLVESLYGRHPKTSDK